VKPIQEQMIQSKGLEQQPLVERLRTRASIRRSIKDRKSVQEGRPDKIADLLDEAADELQRLYTANTELIGLVKRIIEDGTFFLTAVEAKDTSTSDFTQWKKDAVKVIAKVEEEK